MEKEIVYKIKDNTTGLFAMAGTDDYWTKKGKIWRNLRDLILHLNYVAGQKYTKERLKKYLSGDVEIIELVTTSSVYDKKNLKDFIYEIEERKHKQELAYQKRIQEENNRREEKEYKRLKEKYEEK